MSQYALETNLRRSWPRHYIKLANLSRRTCNHTSEAKMCLPLSNQANGTQMYVRL